jgi:hypothetical protein
MCDLATIQDTGANALRTNRKASHFGNHRMPFPKGNADDRATRL